MFLPQSLARLRHHEFWPAWFFYLPLVPYLMWLSVRHRGVGVFSACNPGITNGGGFVGESKGAIMSSLPRTGAVLPTRLIGKGALEARMEGLRAEMAREPSFEFPIILKPDAGERGHAVRLVRDFEQALEYFRGNSSPVVAQPYAAGPCECGIMWIRRADSLAGREEGDERGTGYIYSVTRKSFPHVKGDGVHTLARLISMHPRLRLQEGVFLARLGDRAGEVPSKGEEVRLAVSGNHCQGTMFTDGADLITAELSRVIDELAVGFKGGLDFGRFDVRYTSDEDLRRGLGVSIVEVNGVTSESTNLYDPGRGVWWAYGVLFGQWRRLYELGAARRAAGVRALTLGQLWSLWRGHVKGRTGSALAD